MYQLAVCANTVYLNLPLEEFVNKIAGGDFAVEFRDWHDRALDTLTSGNIHQNAIDSYAPAQCHKVAAAVFGVFLPGILNQGLVLMGAPLQVFRAIAGAIVILSIIFPNSMQDDV